MGSTLNSLNKVKGILGLVKTYDTKLSKYPSAIASAAILGTGIYGYEKHKENKLRAKFNSSTGNPQQSYLNSAEDPALPSGLKSASLDGLTLGHHPMG